MGQGIVGNFGVTSCGPEVCVGPLLVAVYLFTIVKVTAFKVKHVIGTF